MPAPMMRRAWWAKRSRAELSITVRRGKSLIKLNRLDWLLKIIWTQPGRIGFLREKSISIDPLHLFPGIIAHSPDSSRGKSLILTIEGREI